MGRWEPNARGRLIRAALDLFTEQGYDATTVSEIAERAGGLTKTTFFRHFSDKREVLFAAGQEIQSRLMADAIAAAPDSATPLQAVAAAVDAVAADFTDDRRDFSARLLAVIASNSELQERAMFKRAALTEAVTGALHKRGVPDPAASLAAELGTRAYFQAFARWADPASKRSFTDIARETLEEVRAAIATLG